MIAIFVPVLHYSNGDSLHSAHQASYDEALAVGDYELQQHSDIAFITIEKRFIRPQERK